MRRLHGRLVKLEQAIQTRKRQPSPEEVAQTGELWETFVRQVLPTMKEEHHWILDAFVADWNSRDHDLQVDFRQKLPIFLLTNGERSRSSK